MTTTVYTFDMQIWSDLHKDAYGFRPRDGARVAALSDDQKQAEWDRMCADLDAEMDREKQAQIAASARFEARVAELVAMGAGDRDTAIRWLADAEGASYPEFMGGGADMGYLEYSMGLPYGYIEHGRRVEA